MPSKELVTRKKRDKQLSTKRTSRVIIDPPLGETHDAYAYAQRMEALKTVASDIVNDLVPGVDQARKDLRALEKKIANQPETIWHRLQFTVDNVRKDVYDRLPRIEKQYDDMVLLVGRMDRLEKEFKELRDLITSGSNAKPSVKGE